MENFNNTDKEVQTNDDYGLPEHAFQPIERKEKEMTNTNKAENKPFPKKQKAYNWPVIVALFVIFGLSVFIIYFFIIREPQSSDMADFGTVEENTSESDNSFYDESTYASDWETEDSTTDKAATKETEPAEPVETKIGTITQVENFTGDSYVIVNSFFDGDFADDRAKELKAKGYEVFVLHPTEKKPFYRVSISRHESYAAGEVAAKDLKADFGEKIWVLKY